MSQSVLVPGKNVPSQWKRAFLERGYMTNDQQIVPGTSTVSDVNVQVVMDPMISQQNWVLLFSIPHYFSGGKVFERIFRDSVNSL